jgi:hypothetical protein
VQTHGLVIGSGGWLAIAEGGPEPFYFRKEEYTRKEGGVVVDSALLAKNHLPLYPQAPWIRICYMKDMGPLPDDNFSFETTLRSDQSSVPKPVSRWKSCYNARTMFLYFPFPPRPVSAIFDAESETIDSSRL